MDFQQVICEQNGDFMRLMVLKSELSVLKDPNVTKFNSWKDVVVAIKANLDEQSKIADRWSKSDYKIGLILEE